MKKLSLKTLGSALTLSLVFSSTQAQQVETFPLSSVRLLPGPFQQAQQTDLAYILKLNPERLLAPYRREAGLSSAVKSYGNWENTGLDGHIGGHYLTALAQMVAATGDKDATRRLNYMVSVLDSCQRKNGDGYVGGVPGGKVIWAEIKNGKIDAGTFSLNHKWVPLYNIHKTFAGLRDAYLIAGNQQAKGMLIALTDWMLNLTASLSDEQIQQLLISEHGGLNEVFADVAAITGDKKYLKLARRFSDQSTLQPLLNQKDQLNGLHANMQIPKVIGYLRVAQQDQDAAWANAADFFWQTVVHHRTVSIGGNSVREHFHPATNFTSMVNSVEGPETCNSYNMLKLTEDLYRRQPSSAYVDYYERTLYNHILSSQNPEKGGFVYFTPMRPQHYRVYSQPQEGFWCCVGSGMENHGKYGQLIYAHDASSLYVNLFIPSVLTWKEKGLTLTQQTRFPEEEQSRLSFKVTKPTRLALHLRQPLWAKGFQVKVNGKPVNVSADDKGYVIIDRTWKTGDQLSLNLPMTTTAEVLPDSSAWVSFVHGPIVLASATGKQNLAGLYADDSRMGHIAHGPMTPLAQAPLLIQSNPNDLVASIKPVSGQHLRFRLTGQAAELQPFYQIHESRYMIYWPYASPENQKARLKELEKSDELTLKLENSTVDKIATGEQQPESDHGFQGEKTDIGVHEDVHFRRAKGWFSYSLKNKNQAARSLQLTFHSDDAPQRFHLYLNGALLEKVQLEKNDGKGFFTKTYALPEAAQKSDTLLIKFEAPAGSETGPIYEVRLLK
ncbi:glycoside hydrolase family 127 protein [Siphonobacter sp. SORGH_AS_1065]|nr:glycoside hydrolase family 127 protein [Siphonobacter sp. SORGH_AS_1065]MDQ1090243.1 DUF1680 family protein [Siphonobacter sp. SORGH_AS_1065]